MRRDPVEKAISEISGGSVVEKGQSSESGQYKGVLVFKKRRRAENVLVEMCDEMDAVRKAKRKRTRSRWRNRRVQVYRSDRA